MTIFRAWLLPFVTLCMVMYMTLCMAGPAAFASEKEGGWERARLRMIDEIINDVVRTKRYIGKDQLDLRVMDAMAKVPRHQFVPTGKRSYAYENRPLPIGFGQTISQPYIVALMTDLLAPKSHHVVLEVGTGSGYQAAVLSGLVDSVYTIEIIPDLGKSATKRLRQLNYQNVHTRIGDGYYGWEEHAPFDGIVVTAVGGQVPPPLLKQLKPGGRMAIPVGEPFSVQYLMLVEKSEEGRITTHQILPVRFVPLTGKH